MFLDRSRVTACKRPTVTNQVFWQSILQYLLLIHIRHTFFFFFFRHQRSIIFKQKTKKQIIKKQLLPKQKTDGIRDLIATVCCSRGKINNGSRRPGLFFDKKYNDKRSLPGIMQAITTLTALGEWPVSRWYGFDCNVNQAKCQLAAKRQAFSWLQIVTQTFAMIFSLLIQNTASSPAFLLKVNEAKQTHRPPLSFLGSLAFYSPLPPLHTKHPYRYDAITYQQQADKNTVSIESEPLNLIRLQSPPPPLLVLACFEDERIRQSDILNNTSIYIS